ncbi:FGGY-family carbohydrate kinase [Dethiosulfovibrio salsuginis]|uniref:Xylulokinase n=1 Tax=Dethiosulfovibrio salsuginis TaxID=561720 RepID=A0A1X7JW80_9BACT|nr:FGGY-family carbohydrate kinase [Dethiosulfovibrio salsuginis]SMG32348.1 xylulokinase [Dethiosulfovibrio salsuginis]
MNKKCLMGVDVGTSETKGVLVDLSGAVIASASHPHELIIPRQGWAEHDPEVAWWGGLKSVIKDLLDGSGVSSDEIASFGCSTIAPCMVPMDEKGVALRNAVLYGIDTRATEEISELNSAIGEDEIFSRCGNSLSSQAVGPKILWLRKNEPQIYDKAHKIGTGSTYLVARLTGEWWIDHYTACNYVPCYDVASQGWAEDLCSSIVDIDKLPAIGWTSQIAGYVTEEAALETGLAVGTPVIVGATDAASEAVSVGVVEPGQMMLMYGSTLFMVQVTDSPVTDTRLWSAPFLFPGTYSLMAGMATTGVLTKWFRDNCALDLVDQESRDGVSAFSRLAEMASNVSPGAEGLIVLPYFSGERTPINDPGARGTVFGLTLSHGREHIYRAILEGVGHGVRHHVDLLEAIGAAPEEFRAVGGGTKNLPWLQMVSDICGIEQLVPPVTFGASYGDAFLAGLGIGLFADHGDIKSWIGDPLKIGNDLDLKPLYDLYHKVYLDLYRSTASLMHDLGVLSRKS